MSDQQWLTVQQAADILNVHVRTIRAYIASGELAAVQLKREYRISRSDLDIFIAKRRTHGKQEDEQQ